VARSDGFSIAHLREVLIPPWQFVREDVKAGGATAVTLPEGATTLAGHRRRGPRWADPLEHFAQPLDRMRQRLAVAAPSARPRGTQGGHRELLQSRRDFTPLIIKYLTIAFALTVTIPAASAIECRAGVPSGASEYWSWGRNRASQPLVKVGRLRRSSPTASAIHRRPRRRSPINPKCRDPTAKRRSRNVGLAVGSSAR
jgi:hypothetical protein